MKKINLESCDYPYYHLAINKREINTAFRQLKSFSFIVNNKGKDIFIDLRDYKKIEKFLRLADYFSEEIRVKCHFGDYISPYDWFQNNRNKIIMNLQENKEVSFPYYTIDNYIWQQPDFKECSNFPIPIAFILLRYFNVKKWLDPSAGWGDRLTAAICWGCEYQGVDPNLSMQKKYKEIIANYGPGKEQKYNIAPLPFEKFKVPSEYYDLVFTSPPFFKLEKYSSDETQCNIAHPTISKWLNNFLYPLIKKSEKTLIKGGHLALYIADYREIKYVDKCKDFIREKTKLKFILNFTWKQSKSKRYIYIWQK